MLFRSKILKVYEYLYDKLTDKDFSILKSDWNFDFNNKMAGCYFIFNNSKLSETIEHIGPPIARTSDYEKFKQVHSNDKILIRGNRACAIIKRKHLVPETLLKELFNDEYIKSRLKMIKIYK